MNIALPIRQADLCELDRVRLLGRYSATEGTLSPGQEGTVVYRHRGGEAFEVEFTAPFNAVVTLKADEIARIDG